MRRLSLITQVFPPRCAAAAAHLGQLHKYLPEYGYRPTVIAAGSHGSATDDDLVRRVPTSDTATAVSLASTPARWFTRYRSLYDRLSWAPHVVAASAEIIRSQAVEAIYSTSPFLSAYFAALRLKGRFGLPQIADFQDPVCDNWFRA
jgi:hypothetical protein